MGAKAKEWFEQIQYRWQNLSSLMKRVVILGLVSLLVVLGTFYFMMTRVHYGVLFTDLNRADAGIIINDLKEKKIAYKLEDNGQTIMIDQEQIDSYRIDLAVESKLPNSSTGFELFDQSDMMTTDEDRKIMYQRALTGELEQAILSLDGVQGVKVILVTPDDGVFSSEKKDATASIVLTLQRPLTESMIQGIVTLTSGAVENLNVENVKVVDGNGNVLAGGQDDGTLANASDRYISIKNAYEDSLEKKVRQLLEPIYGSNNLNVSINVDLDFDSVERTTTVYNNPEIRSESVEATGSAEAIQEAQTGQVDDNVTVVTGDDAEGDRSYRRSVNNELDTEITTTISAPGMIQRMTSSVVVAGDLPADVQQELRTLVASAVGYNEERGDEIAVQGMNFGTNEVVDPVVPGDEQQGLSQNLWIYLAAVGGLLLLTIVMIIIMLVRRRKRNQEDFLVEDEYEEPTEPIVSAFNTIVDEVSENKTDEERFEEKRRIRSKEEDRDRRAKQFAGDNPEITAELIKAWMKEK
ncbi:flagellar basal-body MS-ring/collar protein FliF [Enterococcus olivae]